MLYGIFYILLSGFDIFLVLYRVIYELGYTLFGLSYNLVTDYQDIDIFIIEYLFSFFLYVFLRDTEIRTPCRDNLVVSIHRVRELLSLDIIGDEELDSLPLIFYFREDYVFYERWGKE